MSMTGIINTLPLEIIAKAVDGSYKNLLLETTPKRFGGPCFNSLRLTPRPWPFTMVPTSPSVFDVLLAMPGLGNSSCIVFIRLLVAVASLDLWHEHLLRMLVPGGMLAFLAYPPP